MRRHSILNGKLIRLLEIGLDLAFLLLALLLALMVDYYIANDTILNFPELFELNRDALIGFAIYLGIGLLFLRTFQVSVILKRYLTVFPSLCIACILTTATLYIAMLLNNMNFRYIIYITTPYCPLIAFAITVLIMSLYKYIVSKILSKINKKAILIYGPEEKVRKLAAEFYSDRSHYNGIRYLVFKSGAILDSRVKELINDIDCVYITAGFSEKEKNILVNYILQKTDKELYMVPETYEIGIQRSSFDIVDDCMILKQKSMHLSLEQRFLKRVLDISISLIVLIIALVPMIITALIIKLQDKGPVFYKQVRLKRNNQLFSIIKFRSMKVKSDEKTLATKNDSRVTSFGKFIRATRIDELPQLINVLIGDMSIVGPRPLLPNIIEETLKEYPEFAYRANVKPGLTGLTQVYGRYDTTPVERLRYDLYYVRNYSFLFDITIMLLTIRVVLSKEAGLGKYDDKSLEEILEMNNIKISATDFGYELN